jgi:thymidylate kinase
MDRGHLARPRRRPVSARINDATTKRPDPSADALSDAPHGAHVLSLVVALAGALDEAQIPYCHFKSNEALDRSMRGEADLDLLIGAEGARSFSEILLTLGFKEARLAAGREAPGVSQSYGLDEPTGRLVQVHAHRHLVIGDHTTKNFLLDIEPEYLAGAVPAPLLRVPRPEHELVLFVLRMVAKHCTLDAMMMLQGKLSPSERRELSWLTQRSSLDRVAGFLGAALPYIPAELFGRCLRAVRPGASVWFRAHTAGRLHRALDAHGRRSRGGDAVLRIWRRIVWGTRRLVRGASTKKPAGGGLLVAIVGGDGAGKSTAVADLAGWLSSVFATKTIHLGKPPPHVATVLLKGPMVVLRQLGLLRATRLPAHRLQDSGAPFPGHAWLLWNVLTARDRYLAYRHARRWVIGGGLVVSDRMPLSQLRTMDGCRTAWLRGSARLGYLARRLVALEMSYYAKIEPPDLLIVLRVDPAIAVQRKLGEDDPGSVRERAGEIFDMDWAGTRAVVIDAARPCDEVASTIRRIVWSRL